MPSARPMTKSGCGRRPGVLEDDGDELVAVGRDRPSGSRANSRSSRSQMAYAAYSRSRSRKARSSARSVVVRATTSLAAADGDGRHQPPTSAAAGLGGSAGRGDRPVDAPRRGRRSERWPRVARRGRRPASNGGRDDALLGDDAGDQLGRRDVEGRVADLRPGRRDRARRGSSRTSSALRSSIGIAAPSGVSRGRSSSSARRRRTGCRGARPARPAGTCRPCSRCRRWRRPDPPRRGRRPPRRGP